MHANLRNAFSIKPENNLDESPWQHLRTEAIGYSKSGSETVGIYGKMAFKTIDADNNLAEINSISIFTHEFSPFTKDNGEYYGVTNISPEIDLLYDTVNPNNPEGDNDSIEQPVYYIKVTLGLIKKGSEAIISIPITLKKDPSILSCDNQNYIDNYQKIVEYELKNNPGFMTLDFPLFFVVVYEKNNGIEEVEEINMFEKAIVGGLKAARAITGKGIIYTVKCRPFYVNLLS